MFLRFVFVFIVNVAVFSNSAALTPGELRRLSNKENLMQDEIFEILKACPGIDIREFVDDHGNLNLSGFRKKLTEVTQELEAKESSLSTGSGLSNLKRKREKEGDQGTSKLRRKNEVSEFEEDSGLEEGIFVVNKNGVQRQICHSTNDFCVEYPDGLSLGKKCRVLDFDEKIIASGTFWLSHNGKTLVILQDDENDSSSPSSSSSHSSSTLSSSSSSSSSGNSSKNQKERKLKGREDLEKE